MKYLIIITTIFVQLLAIQEAHCYPNGAPTSTCANLKPGHGNELHGDHPFHLTVEMVKSSQEFQVTITPKQNGTIFQGFILQARKTGDTKPVGKFVVLPNNTKAIECSDNNPNTATHSNTDEKSSLTFKWVPPANFNASIRFHTTIAITKAKYWKGIVSSEIKIATSKASSVMKSSTFMFITLVFVSVKLFM